MEPTTLILANPSTLTVGWAVNLWNFAEKFGISTLQRDALDTIAENFVPGHGSLTRPSAKPKKAIQYAYSFMPQDSPLHKLVAHAFCQRYLKENQPPRMIESQDLEGLPLQFVDDVAEVYAKLIRMLGRPETHWFDRCDFHGHATEEERANCVSRVPYWQSQDTSRKRKAAEISS